MYMAPDVPVTEAGPTSSTQNAFEAEIVEAPGCQPGDSGCKSCRWRGVQKHIINHKLCGWREDWIRCVPGWNSVHATWPLSSVVEQQLENLRVAGATPAEATAHKSELFKYTCEAVFVRESGVSK